jgi:hypothetical protein
MARQHLRTLVVLLTIGLVGSLTQVSALAYGGFSDVGASTYYAKAVAWAAEEGITTGTSPGCFSPDDTMTRAQSVVMLWRAEGEPKPDDPHPFRDISASWQEDAVAWAAEEGITTGVSSTQFSPDTPLSRAQGAVFLHRFFGEPKPDDDRLDIQCAEGAPASAVTTPVSVTLNSSNTGIRGAIAAGLWPGSVFDPYANLTTYRGDVEITDRWLDENNGGSRVVEGIEVLDGSLSIETEGVTVRYCRVDSDARYPVTNQDGGHDFTLEWCEIDAHKPSGSKAVIGSDFTLRRLDVFGGDDGIYLSRKPGGPVLVDEVYVHHQKKHPGAHADQIQDYHDDITVIQNSKLIGFYKDSNAPIMVNTPSTGVRSRITVRGNYLFGGVVFINGAGRNGSVYEGNYFAWDSSNSACFANSDDVEIGTNYFWEWVDGLSHQGDREGSDGNYRFVPLPDPPNDMPPNGTPITGKSACNRQW